MTLAHWFDPNASPAVASRTNPGARTSGDRGKEHVRAEGRLRMPTFRDNAARAGLRFVFGNGQSPLRQLPETTSGGDADRGYLLQEGAANAHPLKGYARHAAPDQSAGTQRLAAQAGGRDRLAIRTDRGWVAPSPPGGGIVELDPLGKGGVDAGDDRLLRSPRR